MNIHAFIAVSACTLLLSTGALAADEHKDHAHNDKGTAHAHIDKAQHGGVVSVVKDVNYELVARNDQLSLYITDHGKSVAMTGASAKVTLLSGNKKEEALLSPTADSLQAKGAFSVGAGTKVVVQVTLKGQPVQAVRFTLK